mmetsp:Transcript_10873/g.27442  ORF Transcript_10873/g.27442 Transcript_10873/m.27442 type:complete len:233 (-) Transcript_10873:516-1214(-)
MACSRSLACALPGSEAGSFSHTASSSTASAHTSVASASVIPSPPAPLPIPASSIPPPTGAPREGPTRCSTNACSVGARLSIWRCASLGAGSMPLTTSSVSTPHALSCNSSCRANSTSSGRNESLATSAMSIHGTYSRVTCSASLQCATCSPVRAVRTMMAKSASTIAPIDCSRIASLTRLATASFSGERPADSGESASSCSVPRMRRKRSTTASPCGRKARSRWKKPAQRSG